MSANQKSVTLAFVLVAVGLAVKHSWFKAAGTWASAAPGASADLGPLTDVRAAIILYAGLMLVADTQLGAAAPPIAWAVGLIEAMAASKALPGAAGQPPLTNAQTHAVQAGSGEAPSGVSGFAH